MLVTLDELRRFTVARNFFKPTTLKRALHKMGFVQADPIRSPARAQDLILRHRVRAYRVGDLDEALLHEGQRIDLRIEGMFDREGRQDGEHQIVSA